MGSRPLPPYRSLGAGLRKPKWAIAVVILLLAAAWLASGRFSPTFRPRARDVPYVPSPALVVDEMLDLSEVGADDLVYDLGSGDGRIVIQAAARYGARSRGFELDRGLVERSRRSAQSAGVADRVEFTLGDLFEADLGPASVVTLYLMPSVNLRLRPKLIRELAPGTRVVSNTFDMAEWEPDERWDARTSPPAELFRWVIPAAAGGVWNARLQIGDTEQPFTLRLRQRFQELEGAAELEGRAARVRGRLRGDRVELVVQDDSPAGRVEVQLEGTVSGPRLTGTARSVDGEGRWSAERLDADLVGEWLWIGDSEARARGDDAPPNPTAIWAALRVEEVDGRLVATFLESGEEHPVADFYVWGSSLYFTRQGPAGITPRWLYGGLVEGETLSGSIRTDSLKIVPWRAQRFRPEDDGR